jgi:GAF domain-containing protein
VDIAISNDKKEYAISYESFVSIPIIVFDEVINIMLVFSEQNTFGSDELSLLKELARDLEFAISKIKTTETLHSKFKRCHA